MSGPSLLEADVAQQSEIAIALSTKCLLPDLGKSGDTQRFA
jgi:hypothetical protein